MLLNMNPTALGVSGRLSEQIEIALSNGFQAIELDPTLLIRKAEDRGSDLQWQLLVSSKITVGEWRLPLDLVGSEATFAVELAQAAKIAPVAASIGATRAVVTLAPYGDDMPYHLMFELHRKRIAQVAEVLSAHGIQLGLAFDAPAHHREGHAFPFIATAEAALALVQAVNLPNVGLVFDSWQWQLGGGTLEQFKAIPAAQLVSVRLADLPEGYDPATVTETDRLLPGTTNVVDNAAIVDHLQAIGYEGPVSPAPHASHLTGSPRERLVKQASLTVVGTPEVTETSSDEEPVGAGAAD